MSIESLLDNIEDVLENSKNVPFSSKISVDGEEIKTIIEDIRLNMPDELMKARKIASERKDILDAAQATSEDIIAQARDKAKVEYNKILDKANDDAVKMKQEAQKQIKQDTENARRDVKEELAKLAMETAQKVVGESVNAQTDADIYNKFLNESSED